MTYTVLARKYRPRSFDTFVGQEAVVQTLSNALAHQRLHHAYFLTGTRGVGKTTLGRILAKCFNCEAGISANPCGQCASCQEIDAGRSLDLIEIDAASNTKVEEIREILNNVQYAPSRDRFKIYLIDEVHMLSGHSFNALLKTLEEPPAHVKFILATTDPQKLPMTILSRCLQFHLKNMLPTVIEQQLKTVCEKEQVVAEATALQLLSQAADGSMRDALSLLDQAIAYSDNNISLPCVEAMLGSVKKTALLGLLEKMVHKNAKGVLQELTQLIEQGGAPETLLESLLSLLHVCSLKKVVPDFKEPDVAYGEKIEKLSALWSEAQLHACYQIGVTGRSELMWAPSARIGLEMIVLKMLTACRGETTPVVARSVSDVAIQTTPSATPPPLHRGESKTIQSPPCQGRVREGLQISVEEQTPSHSPLTGGEQSQPPRQPTAATPPLEGNLNIPPSIENTSWPDLIKALNLSGLLLLLAENCSLKSFTDNQLKLDIDAAHFALAHDKQQKRLEILLQDYFKKTIQVTITKRDALTFPSPALERKQALDAQTEIATQKLADDPLAQALMETFSATIQPHSTQLLHHINLAASSQHKADGESRGGATAVLPSGAAQPGLARLSEIKINQITEEKNGI